MAKLTQEQLRELIAKSTPNAEIDETPRSAKKPPSSAVHVPNRADLSTKIAKTRQALDAGTLDADIEPAPLDDDQSEIVSLRTEGPPGAPQNRTVLMSKDGEILAEQG